MQGHALRGRHSRAADHRRPKVAGANRSTDAVASTVDLYATILELAGINLTATLPTNLPATSAFYHFSLRPVQASTNVSTGWKDWD